MVGDTGQVPVEASDRRAERWALLDAARKVTTFKRVRECRRATLTGTGNPVLRVGGRSGRAGYAGLATCGSVWSCPCCAAKIAARRAAELEAVMSMVRDRGGVMDMATFTVRHHVGHRLAEVWDAVSYSWSRVTSGKQWQRDKVGMLGWVRVVEVTVTYRNGWHVHVHVMFAWSSPVTEERSAWVAMRAWQRWDRALRRRGFDSTPVRGWDVRRLVGNDDGIAGYFTKAALELTSTFTKDSRAGRSPFALLRDATETYKADDLELWFQYEQASRGRKQLCWSTGVMDLRRMAGLGPEQTDEEIAAEDEGGEDAVSLEGDTWSELSRRGEQPVLLTVTDEGGIAAATEWLDARGLAWAWVRPHSWRRRRGRAPSPHTRGQARAVLRWARAG